MISTSHTSSTNSKPDAQAHLLSQEPTMQTQQPARLRRSFTSRVRAGFTIVEVVVAIGVVLILMYIISLLFTGVSAASDLILSNYQVSTYSSALGAQLRDDVRKMNKNGFMVIRNQAYLDPTTNRWTNLDQIAFMTSGETASQMYGLQWMQPNGGFAPADGSDSDLKRSFTATDARVWYGHVHPIPLPLTPPEHAYSASNAMGPLGAVDSRLWSLGRHSALLAGRFVSMDGAEKTPPDNIWFNNTAQLPSVPTTDFFGSATIRDLQPFVDGRVDVFADPIHATPDAIRSAILYGDIDPTTAPINPPNFNNGIYPWSAPFNSAPTFASLNAYERIEGIAMRIYGQRKVSIDTVPLSQNLMQTQNIIAPFCSNFQVEFAGDYVDSTAAITANPDGFIDIVRTIGLTPNGDPATEAFPQQVYWYGGYDGVSSTRNIVTPTAIYGTGTSTAPGKLLNARVQTIGTNTNLYTAAFGYDKNVTPWPRLLRITVNLQDDKGRLRESYLKTRVADPALETTIDGRQFQFVIEVPQ